MRLAIDRAGRIPKPKWGSRKDGRVTVRLACPDGILRSFVALGHAPRAIDAVLQRVAPAIDKRLRWDVLVRDDFACRYCGRRPPDVELHIDHVIPRAGGGETTLENLVAACEDCNLGKADRLVAVSVAVFPESLSVPRA